MPVYGKGYRRWEGELGGRAFRWLTIAKAGVRLTARSKWLKRFLLVAWLPLLYWGLFFFAVGKLTDAATLENAQDSIYFGVLRGFVGREITDRFIEDPGAFRPAIWAMAVHYFLRYTQIFSVIIVVAIVGPRLVSEDLRSRALALYFAKPLTRFDYVLGKLAVVGFWVGTVTMLPALALYGISVAFSPGVDTIAQTIGIVPRIALFSGVVMLGTGSMVLALSSLTRNPRFLGFAWVGMWVMSSVVSTILSHALFPRFGPGADTVDLANDWTGLLSLLANFNSIGFGIFDVEGAMSPYVEISRNAERILAELSYGHDWLASVAVIGGLAAVSLLVLLRQIGRPGEGGAR